MTHIELKKGLEIPISGEPDQSIRAGAEIRTVGLVGDDAIGMKPTMEVHEGDSVHTGQLIYTDKKNPGVRYTSPGCGKITEINRGKKRKFESIIIELDGDESVRFLDQPGQPAASYNKEQIRATLIESGLWTSLRTRPYGKVPSVDADPASLFITAMDSEPLCPQPDFIISESAEEYKLGLQILRRLVDTPIYYCCTSRELLEAEQMENIEYHSFGGPHPAGLASTHIHFIDPVHENKFVWQIGYQDVIAIGSLFQNGQLSTERIVSLAGPGVKKPSLIRTRLGASLDELCVGELIPEPVRMLSGSVLSGRAASDMHKFLGQYHNQVSVLFDNSGRSLLNWAMPGSNRFSVKPVFSSALTKKLRLPMNTAVWGGHRAIYPLGTYEDVMPLDIIPTYLLRAILGQDTEKSKALGALELIEEDLALCAFTCPGKNDFGPELRNVLTTIEIEG